MNGQGFTHLIIGLILNPGSLMAYEGNVHPIHGSPVRGRWGGGGGVLLLVQHHGEPSDDLCLGVSMLLSYDREPVGISLRVLVLVFLSDI